MLRVYGKVWEASFRKPGTCAGFTKLSAGERSELGVEHEGKGSPRRLWGNGEVQDSHRPPEGDAFSMCVSAHWLELQRLALGPVGALCWQNLQLVFGLLEVVPKMCLGTTSICLSELRAHLGKCRIWTGVWWSNMMQLDLCGCFGVLT